MTADRVGIGWRPELAAGILAHADRFDAVEVLLDALLPAPRSLQRAVRTLARRIPVVLHGVALGAASSVRVEPRRLERIARLVGEIAPAAWSEHLAFVRGGGFEIGHLAAPPRCDATLDGAARNFEDAARAVGDRPHVENVATLFEPPGSDRDEVEWLRDVVAATGCPLLLDLHNLHANARNHGYDAHEALSRLPLHRVEMVHVAGGHVVTDAATGRELLLDDHLHDPPEAVHALLEELAARAPNPVTVFIERDGRYPPMEVLLAEVDALRRTLERGRARRPVAARGAA